ncbi:hypothetical protein CCHL11_10421 [Colletotrichum chlorophyti]|uniref:Uncharacterized protein n=1 Tax=Colletotrichum chlorophyti TaxID=708187 RepID=A0A1Q8R9A8_9PEZI|nr:hypothetical protein CCHL11_10421 [Colletotrichum chlorophyti]
MNPAGLKALVMRKTV